MKQIGMLSLCILLALVFFPGEAHMQDASVMIGGTPFSLASEHIALSENAADIAEIMNALPAFSALKSVNVCLAAYTDAEIDQLEIAYPNIEFIRLYEVGGQKFASDIIEIDLSGAVIDDLYRVTESLYRFPRLQCVFFGESAFSNDELAKLREDYRAYYDIVWTLKFGKWSLRTDSTAFSTLNGSSSKRYDETTFVYLKYCDNLMALDLGHNSVKALDFLYDLPNLRILILADNKVKDITPIGACVNMEYLELFMNNVSDLTPLSNCKNLLDLNLNFCRVTDFSPLYELNGLERLWMNGNSYYNKQVRELREIYPDANIDTTSKESTGNGWRRHDRYWVVRYIFQNRTYVPWTADVPKTK